MRLGLVVGIALILIGLFAGASEAQQDRCIQARQDGQKRINENFEQMAKLRTDFITEVNRCGSDSVCIERASDRYKKDSKRYTDDNEKIRAGWLKTCQEEANRQQERQTNRPVIQPQLPPQGSQPPFPQQGFFR